VWKGEISSAKALASLGCNELSSSCKGSTRKAMAKGRKRDDAIFEPIERQLLDVSKTPFILPLYVGKNARQA